jgi:hypothetical protein
VLYSSHDHLRTGTRDLDHLVLAGVRNTTTTKFISYFGIPFILFFYSYLFFLERQGRSLPSFFLFIDKTNRRRVMYKLYETNYNLHRVADPRIDPSRKLEIKFNIAKLPTEVWSWLWLLKPQAFVLYSIRFELLVAN